MQDVQICPECGAAWRDGIPCEAHFHQMLYWENEFPDYGVVHHLTVLCYYLQHPSLYSPDGLREGRRLLVEFVANGVRPQDMRRRMRGQVDSSRRTFTIKGKDGARGAYAHSIPWPMTAADVVAQGADHYVESVRQWARSAYEALVAAGEMGRSDE
ncbi:MAG: hypothetical protein IT320_27205 [Anaerolineae bacterium]|nr:hypothetical protein [Anaerolineae bacterium]